MMCDLLEINEVSVAAWPALASRFDDHNYENSACYLQAQAARTGTIPRFFSVGPTTDPAGLIACRLKKTPLIDRGIVYISSGPLWQRRGAARCDPAPVLRALYQYFCEAKKYVTIMRLPIGPQSLRVEHSPLLERLGFLHTDVTRSYKTVLLDLFPALDKLRSGLHPKWRNRLNQSEKLPIDLEIGSGPEFSRRFFAIYTAMKEKKEFSSILGPDFFAKLDQTDLGLVTFIAKLDGVDAGALVLSILGANGVDLFAATNEAGRDSRAGYYLRWAAINYLREHNCRWYDLGGVDQVLNPNGFEFKSRMGGEVVAALGPYKAVPGDAIGRLLDRVLVMRKRGSGSRSEEVAVSG